MRSETVYLFALISLRALAEHDSFEFRRSTDLSKGELTERIQGLLSDSSYYQEDQPLVAEARQQWEALQLVEFEGGGQTELSFLLRQLSRSSLTRAQQLALKYANDGGDRVSALPPPVYRPEIATYAGRVGLEEEILRLGAMRLLKELPNYLPRFSHQFRSNTIGCFLEPIDEGLPPIILEAKMQIRSTAEYQVVMRQLKKVTAGWGRNVIGIILTPSTRESSNKQWEQQSRNLFPLFYNLENNEFSPVELENFRRAVSINTILGS